MKRVTRLWQGGLAIPLFLVAGLRDASAAGGGSPPIDPAVQIDQAFQQYRVGYLAGNVRKMEAAQERAVKGYVRILSKKGEDEADSVSVALIEKYSVLYPKGMEWVRSFFVGAKQVALNELEEYRRNRRARAYEASRGQARKRLLRQAVDDLGRGDPLEAANKFGQADEMGPIEQGEEQMADAYVHALAWGAEVHWKAGRGGECVKMLETAVEACRRLGMSDKERRLADRLVEQRRLHARNLFHVGRLDEAVSEMEKVVAGQAGLQGGEDARVAENKELLAEWHAALGISLGNKESRRAYSLLDQADREVQGVKVSTGTLVVLFPKAATMANLEECVASAWEWSHVIGSGRDFASYMVAMGYLQENKEQLVTDAHGAPVIRAGQPVYERSYYWRRPNRSGRALVGKEVTALNVTAEELKTLQRHYDRLQALLSSP